MTSNTKHSVVSQKIKELREQAQMSMQEFANRIGVSKSAVSLFEKGSNNPKLDTLNRIVQEFNVSLEWLTTASSYDNLLSNNIDNRLLDNRELIDLPLITHTEFTAFAQQCQAASFPNAPILPVPGHDYQGAAILEVRGNSMAPRYPERARFIIRPVEKASWPHAHGVHAVVLNSELLLLKRITSNREGMLELSNDATGEKIEVTLSEVSCLWKVSEGVYYPAED